MNKYLLLSLALLLPSMMHGYTVYINNKTQSKGDFYVHTNLKVPFTDACSYGCGAQGKFKATIEAGKLDKIKVGGGCIGACIKCVSVKLYVGNKTVEFSFDLEKAANALFAKAYGAGIEPGQAMIQGNNYFSPGGEFVAAIGGTVILAGSIGGVIKGVIDVERFQCTSMELTLEQTGAGDKADDYRWNYKKR